MPSDDGHVFTYMDWVIAEKVADGKWRTADNYRATFNRLQHYYEIMRRKLKALLQMP